MAAVFPVKLIHRLRHAFDTPAFVATKDAAALGGSIGPFNRAFKQMMNTVPTSYRKGDI